MNEELEKLNKKYKGSQIMDIRTKEFIDFAIKDNELYYTALIARAKYLSKEERNLIKLNHNMLDIKLFKPIKELNKYDNYMRMIYRYQCSEAAYLDKNGNPLLDKCKAIYAGVNPIDIMKATRDFQVALSLNEYKVYQNKLNLAEAYTHIPRLFLTKCTQSRKRKDIIDIDVDIEMNEVQKGNLEELLEYIKDNCTTEQQEDIGIVYTKGGFHLLCRTEHFDRGWHSKLIERIVKDFMCEAKEAKINKIEMCPLPGTYQCGKIVGFEKLINHKETL